VSVAAPGAVTVMGAGAVGCHVGGCLQAAGVEVHFVGRPRVLADLRAHGLRVTDLDGRDQHLAAPALHLHASPPAAPGLVLLCVKSAATAEAARALAAGSVVVSLQNGVSNVATASAAAPALTVLAGMVPFNIAEVGPGHFHRGTAGVLAVQDHPALAPWAPVFAAAGLPLARHADLRAVQWGKLLLNLNNPVNALSGLPLRAELLDRDCRLVLAALQREALAALRAAGVVPAKVAPLPPRWLPPLLSLPTPIFERVAARMLKIDARARSSMADDLALGRKTEIDAFCGEVVRLARAHGLDAPLNARIQRLVETDPRPRSGKALRAELGV
jgi:2-dehydropantoate 2-reductase